MCHPSPSQYAKNKELLALVNCLFCFIFLLLPDVMFLKDILLIVCTHARGGRYCYMLVVLLAWLRAPKIFTTVKLHCKTCLVADVLLYICNFLSLMCLSIFVEEAVSVDRSDWVSII